MPSVLSPVERAEQSLRESRKALAEGRESDADPKNMMLGTFEDSMKMFLTAVKNQDPMDPMDATQMADKVFQLFQANALHGVHEGMQESVKVQKQAQVLSTAELIGRTVEVNGDHIELDGAPAEMSYQLPTGIAAAKLQIMDEKGGVVYEHDFTPVSGAKELAPGEQKVNWDGFVNTPYGKKQNGGKALQDGIYKVKIIPYDAKGDTVLDQLTDTPLQIPTKVRARLKGSDFSHHTPKLMVAGQYLPLSDLVNIQENNQGQIQSDRLAELREVMAPLDPSEQKAIRKDVKAQAKESLKEAAKQAKFEERMNHLSAAQYSKILQRALDAQNND